MYTNRDVLEMKIQNADGFMRSEIDPMRGGTLKSHIGVISLCDVIFDFITRPNGIEILWGFFLYIYVL